MNIIITKDAPDAIGPYSQAIVSNGFVFTSGQVPINPASASVDAADIVGQTRQAINNLSAILKAAGSSLEKVVKTTCYLTDMEDFKAFNEVYETFFPGKPARSCVEVSKLPKGVLVEIEVVAEV